MDTRKRGSRKAPEPAPNSAQYCLMQEQYKDAVLALLAEGYPPPIPWKKVQKVLAHDDVVGQVVVKQGRVLAAVIYQVLDDRIHLQNLAVASDERRRGLGASIIGGLVGALGRERVALTVDVRETNVGGQLFLKKVGFRLVQKTRSKTESFDRYRFAYTLPAGRFNLKPDGKDEFENPNQ